MVMWWALALSALMILPVLFWIPLPQGRAWYYVLASAFAQSAYLGLLSLAYSLADFSLVYPVARGSAAAYSAGAASRPASATVRVQRRAVRSASRQWPSRT